MLFSIYSLIAFSKLIQILYFILFAGVVWYVWARISIRDDTRKAKLIRGAVGFSIVFALFYGWMLPDVIQSKIERHKRIKRYNTAKAIFDERCKTAGEKIYRTVENVAGITLLKVRPEYHYKNAYDPMWPDAALKSEGDGKYYIEDFLYPYLPQLDSHGNENGRSYGYQYVDVDDNGVYKRYRKGKKDMYDPLQIEIVDQLSRYGVTYENMVDPEDRKYWVAGTKVTVLDTQSNEILGESIWYAFDPAQGAGRENRNSGRPPWSNARVCPRKGLFSNPTRLFVTQVLHPPKPLNLMEKNDDK